MLYLSRQCSEIYAKKIAMCWASSIFLYFMSSTTILTSKSPLRIDFRPPILKAWLLSTGFWLPFWLQWPFLWLSLSDPVTVLDDCYSASTCSRNVIDACNCNNCLGAWSPTCSIKSCFRILRNTDHGFLKWYIIAESSQHRDANDITLSIMFPRFKECLSN